MYSGVTDTHALIWYIWANPKMSPAAKAAIESAVAAGTEIGVSTMTLIEIVYLAEKGRIDRRTHALVKALLTGGEVFGEVPITGQIAEVLRTIPRHEVPDMPDRVIAATAVHLSVPLISRDGKIRASSVTTIW